MSPIRILIVEDDPLIAAEIADCLLQLNYTVSGKAYTVASAMRLLAEQCSDAVLLDINLAGGQEGIQLAEHIRQHYQLPFVFLSSYADRATLEAAKHTEPAGYIVKPFTERDLLAGLEIALFNHTRKRDRAQPELTIERLNAHLLSPLTEREFELLQLMRDGSTNQQIANSLFVSLNTVKTHLKNLFLKLGVSTRTAAVEKARQLMQKA